MEIINISHNPVNIYAKKKAKFFNLSFYVDQRVYVPNPETELMVEQAIQYIQDNNLVNGTFVDVGTGCGNIAITLSKHFPKSRIVATDISLDAIEIAKKNASFHNVHNIEFVNTNLLFSLLDQPDFIIGNLPWGDDDHLLPTNTKEFLSLMPAVSIFAPDGIIGTYNRLIEQIKAKNWTVNLMVETGVLEKEIIEANLQKNCNWDYTILKHDDFLYSVSTFKFSKRPDCEIQHHHLLYTAIVTREDLKKNSSKQLAKFLRDLVGLIDMQILIPPKIAMSHNDAWTGFVCIVTSHIAFHYWAGQNTLQLDIYSCKSFDVPKTINFLNEYWMAQDTHTLFVERPTNSDYKVTNL